MVNPYDDTVAHYTENVNTFIRIFNKNVDINELIWHRDRNNRNIIVKEGKGWKLQMDNELPQELIEDKQYRIEKEEYHRLIKGSGDLVLEITEDI